MSFFTFLKHDDNEFMKSGTVLTPGSEVAAYPGSNVKLLPIANTWRTGGVANETLLITLESAMPINLLGFKNHNLTPSAVVTFNGGSTPNPDGGQFTTTLTWRKFDLFKSLAAAEMYKYWKLIVQDPTNTDGYLEFGGLLGGSATTFGFNFSYGFTVEDLFENLGEYRFGVPNFQRGFDQVQIGMFWEEMTAAESNTLRAVFRSLAGNLKPLFLIPDPEIYEGYFGRFTSSLRVTRHRRHSARTTFTEDSRGLSMAA